MKFSNVNFFSLLAIFLVSILIISCEQDTLIPAVDPLEAVPEEGSNNINMEDDAQSGELFFEAHFDADMNAEEAQKQADKMLNDYISSLDTEQLESRGENDRWVSCIYLNVGDATTGDITIRMNFNTNWGSSPSPRVSLPRSAREKGQHFYYRTHRHKFNGRPVFVSWVEAKWVEIAMRGTDAWYVKNISVRLNHWQQTRNASGGSQINSSPHVWLDSSHSLGWDFYKATGGSGRLNF